MALTRRLGDSLSAPHSAPGGGLKRSLLCIVRWVKAVFKIVLKLERNDLPCGRQNDSYSCGVCAINAIAHHLFGDQLFTPKESRLLRIRYFNILGGEHLSEQNVSPLRTSHTV